MRPDPVFCAALFSAVLSSGCATLETVKPVEAPGPSQAVEEALAEIPDRPVEPAEPAEPAEARTPLKDLLLERQAAGASGKEAKPYTVRPGDTLSVIAKRNRVSLTMLKEANGLDSDRILAGQKLVIPDSGLRIRIDKSDNELSLFSGEERIRAYPVATGDQGVTPTGSFSVANRLIRPTWYWQGHAVTPEDPDYPLGTRWLGLSKRGYGIHGTNEPELIGQQVSHGCIRMLNEDVEDLFEVVSVGTPVEIIE